MLKAFVQGLTEIKHGKTIKEFASVPLSRDDRSLITFLVNEKNGRKKLILMVQDDEGDEVEREYCEVDINQLDEISALVEDVRNYVKNNS